MDTDEVLILLLAVWALLLTVAFIVRAVTPSRSRGPMGYTGAAGMPGPQGPKGDKGDSYSVGTFSANQISTPVLTYSPDTHPKVDPLSGNIFFTDHKGMEVPSTFVADSSIGRLGTENRQLQKQIDGLEQERRGLLDVVSAIRKDNRKKQEEMMDQSANHQAEQKRLDADAVMLRRHLDDVREDNELLKKQNRFYMNHFGPKGSKGEE